MVEFKLIKRLKLFILNFINIKYNKNRIQAFKKIIEVV